MKLRDMLEIQKEELTEHLLYKKLAERDEKNKKLLTKISREELSHYNFWKNKTKRNVRPKKLKILFYYFLSYIFGITFALKLLESVERKSIERYSQLARKDATIRRILKQELEHKNKIIKNLKDERVYYLGSTVLGLNDALVELTGVLAGLTFALGNNLLIAVAGFVTGVAASLSMASSEYLAKRIEATRKAKKAALHTGVAYILTVIMLILPFVVLKNPMLSLAATLTIANIIILFFSFFTSVVSGKSIKQQYLEMFIASMGVAAISFALGYVLKINLNI